jgi:hypothetical protein
MRQGLSDKIVSASRQYVVDSDEIDKSREHRRTLSMTLFPRFQNVILRTADTKERRDRDPGRVLSRVTVQMSCRTVLINVRRESIGSRVVTLGVTRRATVRTVQMRIPHQIQ